MKEKRIFRDAQQARNLVPAWLSPILAGVFVIVGQGIGQICTWLIVIPIFLILTGFHSLGRTVLGSMGDLPVQVADVFIIWDLISFVFIGILIFSWVRAVEKRPFKTEPTEKVIQTMAFLLYYY